METILIVDDNKDLQFTLSSILKEEGYCAIAVGDGKRAVREIETRSPNLVLLDIKLPESDGMKILEQMKTIDKDLIIIMLTAYGDVKGAVRAMKLGAFDYITKPFDNEEIILIIKKALKIQYLSKEVQALRKRLSERAPAEETMGSSPQIKQVFNQVKIIAPTNMTVILQGESGTGKELIAQMIHQGSARKEGPFIAIDSGAIPETLVESELFGYEKGAFTGADDTKEGKFEQANGGTLFLDEITNLTDTMQTKLLRVIQERRIQRLGGRKDIKIDVRILVATNTRLSGAGHAGRFRQDLFYRLNEFHIDLPPLRERKDDIPALARCFLDEANCEHNKTVKRISGEAMRFLFDYHWPGNVRELKNTIRKAALLTESDEILPSALPREVVEAQGPSPCQNPWCGRPLEDTIRKAESGLIEKALAHAGGNKIKAARLLNMNRKTLYRKLKALSL